MSDKVMEGYVDPDDEFAEAVIVDIMAAEALPRVLDPATMRKVRHARYVIARRASDNVAELHRLRAELASRDTEVRRLREALEQIRSCGCDVRWVRGTPCTEATPNPPQWCRGCIARVALTDPVSVSEEER